MRYATLCFYLLLAASTAAADCPGPGRLSEALSIVEAANPVLSAKREAAAEQARQRPWKADVTVGYSITETFETGDAGPNARINVRIPLWDRGNKLQQAKDAAALAASVDALRSAFINDMQALCQQAHEVRALIRRREFTEDRMAYRQERVDQGIDAANDLWSEAEKMQTAAHAAEKAGADLDAARLSLARQYAGHEWVRLQVLLEAMTQ